MEPSTSPSSRNPSSRAAWPRPSGTFSTPDVEPVSFFIVCDFDGTITEHDTLNLVVRRYAPDVWDRMERQLQDGTMTLVEAMYEEFRNVRASEAEVVEYVLEEAGIRPGFPEFVEWVEGAGHELVVVSAGFRVLIDAVLERAGLHHLHVHAGDASFSPEGTTLSFPPATAECLERCGHCKSETIERHAPFPGPVVYVGDGFSDRCPAQEADVVFARRELAAYLDDIGVGYHPYDDFFQIRDALVRMSEGR